MKPAAVTVVIPVWNGRRLLAALLEKLKAQTYPIAEVIAVDNGSEDGAAEEAERWGARALRLGANRGFAVAVNCGIEATKTELLALVNSDVEPEPEWLARLVGALEAEDVWFAAGKILSAARRDRIDGAWDLLSRGGCAWRAGSGLEDGPEYSRARRIEIAPATAALFRAELFRRLGTFDTAFESYLEDVDFGLRCALAGLGGAYVPEAVAYHWGSASLGEWSPAMVRLIARNQVRLVAKHYPAGEWWPILVGQLLWGLVAVRHGAGWAFLQGKMEGVRKRPRERRTPDPALDRMLGDHEREIRRANRDWYWKMYFLLTSGGTD